MTSFGRKKAREFVQKHRTSNVYELCHRLSIPVYEAPLRKLNGFIDQDIYGAYIVLNKSLPLSIKRFIIAHELGHFVMHPHDVGFFWVIKKTNFDIGCLEKHADDFACELLGISMDDYNKVKECICGFGKERATISCEGFK